MSDSKTKKVEEYKGTVVKGFISGKKKYKAGDLYVTKSKDSFDHLVGIHEVKKLN